MRSQAISLGQFSSKSWIGTSWMFSWFECSPIVCSRQYIFSLCPPLLLVAPVIYWFSARLPLLSVAHCWQSFSLPAGLQSSSLSTAFLREISWKLASFILQAEKSCSHKFTTWLLKFHTGDPFRMNGSLRKPLCMWGSPCTTLLSAGGL